MGDWRDQILREFTPQVARLTLVADPNGLLLEEGVLQAIRERGFELIPFDDHVSFRYAYESRFRSRWDHGEDTCLLVVLRSGLNDLNSLPYDLLETGRKLSFNLGDLFPNLSYPVVASLNRGDLDSLYQAQNRQNPGQLGDNSTKDFILLQVFEIAPELIKQPSDLLRVLLRRHYRGQSVPPMLDERFISVLRQRDLFNEWPLEKIIPDKHMFLAFLQERWPIFLDRITGMNISKVEEQKQSYGLAFEGPADLPFDHDDVRVYIDSLFLEGLLHPVQYEKSALFTGKWVAVGIHIDEQADHIRRLDGLIKSVEGTLPGADARYQDWMLFAYRWGELKALLVNMDREPSMQILEKITELREHLDSTFLKWVENRFAGLHNQPAVPPVMLHHIPSFLARELSQSEKAKVALLLIDGLALDQWVVMREVLGSQCPDLRFHEEAVFAWVPTITSVSRQSAFAGKAPLFFPSSIYATNKESMLWTQFWSDQGLNQNEVAYAKGIGDGNFEEVKEILSYPKVRAIGLIVDKVDKIMHGMELGTAGMHNQIRQWTIEGYMAKLLNLLLEHNFQIFLTSDHGNIEATGYGRPSEGVIADLRGERARIYPDSLLRSKIKERFLNAIEWPALGLPDDFLPLLAPDRLAFIAEGTRIVAHGGISIEELIVPLIRMEKKSS
ncbi:MAG: BREX-3 system phosphatase PglZ [Thermodesulfobacteriota bacterium]|nr:BREX-3 system phosphatase PglZ [Thermodesulfobacteriota bacterium]